MNRSNATSSRFWFLLAMLLVVAHGVFYVVLIPPWDLFDEEQHLDYALTLRDERRIPHIDEPIRQSIVDSAVETDRWSTFQIGRPESTVPEEMGLEGRSFEGYQPPLYYALVALVTIPAGDDVLLAMYLGRSLGVLLPVVFAATGWALARRWLPGSSVCVPLSAALVAGGVPAAASAAGRVNNDLLVAVLIGLTLLATVRLVDRPEPRRAWLAGMLAAAAILTKSTGLLALAIVLAGVWMLWRKDQRLDSLALRALLPGSVGLVLWTAFTYARYGTLSGTSAFLELVVPFDSISPSAFLGRTWLNAWSSYWGAYSGDLLRIGIGIAVLLVIAAGGFGYLVRGSGTLWRPRVVALLVGILAGGLLIVLWVGNVTGLVHPHGRILLPVYPAAAALLVGGWSRLHPRAALVPGVLTVVGAVVFAAFWFVPFFYGSGS